MLALGIPETARNKIFPLSNDLHAAGKSFQLLPAKDRGMLGYADVTGLSAIFIQMWLAASWQRASATPPTPMR